MEEKKHCKWYNDEICTNGESPCVADYCPVVEYPELCKHRETIKHRVSWKAKFFKSQEEIKRLTRESDEMFDRHAKENQAASLLVEKRNNEIAELQKQVDELKEQFLSTCENCHLKKDIELLRYQKEQAVKDTAKEILQKVLEDIGEFYAGDIVEELAKHYGIEVE